MYQDEYRNKTGEEVADAELQQDEEQEIEQEDEIEQDEQELELEPEEADDLPPLNEKEKTAFEKRLERDKAKIQAKLEEEFRQKYSRHDELINMLGGDPEAIEKRIRDSQLAQEAQRLADANDWSEADTEWYMNDQRQKQEVKEMRVQISINKLSANPDYAGIGSMEKQILDKIDKSNGALSVEEAYWALGGPKKSEQIRLEAQLRESEKRKKTPRTVITDNTTSNTAEKPLPPEIVREAERMGITMEEARRLMSRDATGTLEGYRKRKAK